jgi:hypothetical protein
VKTHRICVDVEPGDSIRLIPPRVVDSVGGPLHIPWAVTFAERVELSFLDVAKLDELRDAITAALDERGEQ